jgi:hypothetical protein
MRRTSKRELRERLEQEVKDYLNQGGAVRSVARGESALVNGRYDEKPLAFEKPKEERTPVDELLKNIDHKRASMRKTTRASTKSSTVRKPKKKVIYDDFGEPLRVIWEDDS